MREIIKEGWLFSSNLGYLHALYDRYESSPDSLDKDWKDFFVGLNDLTDGAAALHDDSLSSIDSEEATSFLRLMSLIRSYRQSGFCIANLNPLKENRNLTSYGLEPGDHGINSLDCMVKVDGLFNLCGNHSIRNVVDILNAIYCQNIGYEFMHISDPEQRDWILNKIENCDWHSNITKDKQVAIFRDLLEAELFENFLQVRYPGAKRFSLEGSESMIVAINSIIEHKASVGLVELLIGMPHRGRLNVLTKIMGKSYEAVFAEFLGVVTKPDIEHISGDVKYHLGFSQNRQTNFGNMHISLLPNPSHLEAVNPVLLGKIYAKKCFEYSAEEGKISGILMHGDAAFSCQGVVYESMVMGGLPHYDAGGVVHIIVNNQLGFTTDPICARSTTHPSFIAKSLDLPVFHVNSDDPESVSFVANLASEFSHRFKRDSLINMVCYRKFGHNEADEPRFTQPVMYKDIDSRPTPSQAYESKLLSSTGELDGDFFSKMKNDFNAYLEQAFKAASSYKPEELNWFRGRWSGFVSALEKEHCSYTVSDNGLDKDYLKKIAEKINSYPLEFNMHPKVVKLLKSRLEAFHLGDGIDWANAESIAFATLVDNGVKVRLSGQDCCRGTFSQRHAVMVDQETGECFTPLHALKGDEFFEVVNSPLSEYGVLGFEYGYSLVEPNSLVLWEAQFGDFVNGAQIIIDQFIASAESKWLRSSGLVMLLPHGYEGQGPEHSSGRIERFLQLCAEDNLRVVNCTTPANYFHVLRRQVDGDFRKPLIVFTPKSLLRHTHAVSSLEDLTGAFCPVLFDNTKSIEKIKKLVFCSGKVYYDLLEECDQSNIDDVMIIRLEQIYPFPQNQILGCLHNFANGVIERVVWCQEEPQNMGAWFFIQFLMNDLLSKANLNPDTNIVYAGRPAAAVTASGYFSIHLEQQKCLINSALK